MAWIAPNTTVYLLNVPWNNDYNDTLFFTSVEKQTAFFQGQNPRILNKQSYQRVTKNQFRCSIPADELYGINYMAFRNTAYGDKWFYAFVTDVSYVNNGMSLVTYELDVMQTYMCDYNMEYCLVVREHTDDKLFENYVDEGLDTGEYMLEDYHGVMGPTPTPAVNMIVVAIIDSKAADFQGGLYSGVYSAAKLYAYSIVQLDALRSKLNEYKEDPNSIICVYMCPQSLLVLSGNEVSGNTSSIPKYYHFTAPTGSENIDGYIPKNKKLYCYPYMYQHFDNGSGSSIAVRYEFLNDPKDAQVEYYGNVTPPVTVVLHPVEYKEAGSLMTEGLTLSGYPQCIVASDAYAAWLAQNSVDLMLGAVGGAGSALMAGALTGNPMAMVGGLVGSAVDTASRYFSGTYKSSIQADITRGSFGGGSPNVAANKQDFYTGRAHITKEYAMMIDEYFTMFGYKVNRVEHPVRNTRRRFNYLKTANCKIAFKSPNGLPADAEKQICQIYDKGITFWHHVEDFGDYRDDNPPIGTATSLTDEAEIERAEKREADYLRQWQKIHAVNGGGPYGRPEPETISAI